MNFKLFFVFFPFILIRIEANRDDENLTKLLGAVRAALLSGGVSEEPIPRGPQNYYYPPSSAEGISLRVYEALRSITGNDDLECVPRLVCEAAAGGRPGYSGRKVITQFDKPSLTRLMSYLDSNAIKSSPILTFARAALLGMSNRGNPYSCIINYSKCPRDQSRLLHYLNNHRGGLFRYFDGNYYHSGNNHYYQHQYYYPSSSSSSSSYYYRRHPNSLTDYNRNKISFGDFDLRKKIRQAKDQDVYAKKYAHSAFKFPVYDEEEEYEGGNGSGGDGSSNGNSKKPMVFPESRILTKGTRTGDYPGSPFNKKEQNDGNYYNNNNNFFFRPNRFPKKLLESNFFPDEKRQQERPFKKLGLYATSDRLPAKFHFPLKTVDHGSYGDEDPPSSNYLSENSFFPRN